MKRRRCARRADLLAACLVAVALAGVLVSPSSAAAEKEELSRAQALFDAFRYNDAFTAYQEALAVKGNSPREIADIYMHLGIIAASMDRPSEASEHFKRLLCIEPQAQLFGDAAPKILGPFLVAQESMDRARCFRLRHTPPAERPASGPLRLEVELEPDALGLATGLTARFREAGRPSFVARALTGTGKLDLELAAAEVRPGHDVEYFLQVNSAHGGVVYELGSESSPIVVRAAALPAPSPAASASAVGTKVAPDAPTDELGLAESDREDTWIWAAAGGATLVLVAAGVATAVAVILEQESSTSVQFGRVSYRIAGE